MVRILESIELPVRNYQLSESSRPLFATDATARGEEAVRRRGEEAVRRRGEEAVRRRKRDGHRSEGATDADYNCCASKNCQGLYSQPLRRSCFHRRNPDIAQSSGSRDPAAPLLRPAQARLSFSSGLCAAAQSRPTSPDIVNF
jgi:hypothetical protein